MLVGIHKDPYGKFHKYCERYEDILNFNGIEHIRLDASQPDFWEQVAKLDLFIFHWRQIDNHHQLAKTLIPIIEKEMGIKCFPNMRTCWHYDDKIRQYYLLKHHGFPVIESWIFWDKKEALHWIENAEFPLVFKLKGGAGSNNVILVKSKGQAKRHINRMFGIGIKSGHVPDANNIKFKYFNLYKELHHLGGNILRKLRDEDISPFWQKHKNYVLFQKFLSNNEYDTRVTIIGERAYALQRRNRKNDFRASGSGLLNYKPSDIDLKFVKIGFRISKKLGFQSMAYDFIYDENRSPRICEISYAFPYGHFLLDCPGYWDSNLNWNEGHFWPQYFQLIDALNMPDLKQPEMEL